MTEPLRGDHNDYHDGNDDDHDGNDDDHRDCHDGNDDDDDDDDGDDDGLQLVNPSSHRAQIRLGIYGILYSFSLDWKVVYERMDGLTDKQSQTCLLDV